MKILYLALIVFPSIVQAYVQVNPVRFYVKDAKFGHFTVRNTQSKSVHVEIDNKYFEMKPDGKMIQDNKNATDELKKILFTPKDFVLGPGDKQVVRFFVKDELKGAELRTFAHLLTDIQSNLVEKDAGKGPTMSLTAKVALAIPVIYRTKLDKENASFQNDQFTQKEDDCVFSTKWFNKTHSSYINFLAFDKEGKEIFKINGVSNYLPEYQWIISMPKTKCKDIKKIQVFDVDNDVNIISRDINL